MTPPPRRADPRAAGLDSLWIFVQLFEEMTKMKRLNLCAPAWAVAVLASLSTVSAVSAETFAVDTAHSSVVFGVKHMNVSNFYGRFNRMTGTFTLDDADAAGSAIEITIETESIDTANEKRDAHLKSADFFNSREFSKITFKSTKVESAGAEKFKVTGDLNLHGVTKSITVDVERTGKGSDGRGGVRCGIETRFTIKRSDYGMDYMLNGVGDEVSLIVSLEGIQQ
jgi:polyisoprenoid-binding protein YceI